MGLVRMTIDFAGCRVALLDCCSLLNLYTSRRLTEVIDALPVPCAVADAVVDEAIYVLRGGSGDDASQREAVDLKPFIDSGHVRVWRPETNEEFESFVDFAAEIDDGEAATCALAVHRTGAVVTDDRKTQRVMARSASRILVLSTSQTLKHWADSQHLNEDTLRPVLRDIQERTRFVPGRHDPLLAW